MPEEHLTEALSAAARYAAEVLALRERLAEEREGYKLALILLLQHGRHAERCRVWDPGWSPCSCGWTRVRDDVLRDLRARYEPTVDGRWPGSWARAS
jgi:hypothetical protein